MSEAEQARRRREKILKNAPSRMEAVGGAFGGDAPKPSSAPDPLESERKYEQRLYETYKQRVEGSWIVLLLSCSILYGWKYHTALWPSQQLPSPPIYLPAPSTLLVAGLITKLAALSFKLPAAPPSTFDQIVQTVCASLPPGTTKIISVVLTVHSHSKLLGDVIGDVCLGLFTVQITMLILYLMFEL